jgi:hypothetical protein
MDLPERTGDLIGSLPGCGARTDRHLRLDHGRFYKLVGAALDARQSRSVIVADRGSGPLRRPRVSLQLAA